MGTAAVETVAVVVHDSAIEQFMPVMNVLRAVERYNTVLDFTQQIMKKDKDYGIIPGTPKPTLLKPGAEKLCSFFGLSPEFVIVEKVQEWTGSEPFFYYWYKCRLWRGTPNAPGSLMVAEADGSCNSRESKYRYRWVSEHQLPPGADVKSFEARGGRTAEPVFAINKAETSGKYGKPGAYWQAFKDAIEAGTAVKVEKEKKGGGKMEAWEIDTTVYRVPNPDVCDQVNTVQKMSQKRALIAVTLIACNASEYYTQDLEDMADIETHGSKETIEQVAERRIAEEKAKLDIPEELQLAHKNWADKETPNKTFRYLRDELIKAGMKDGDEAYLRITGAFREKFPKGGLVPMTAGDLWQCALDLFNALEGYRDAAEESRLKGEREKRENPQMAAEISMENLPFDTLPAETANA